MKMFTVSEFKKINFKEMETTRSEDFLVVNAKTKKILFRVSPILSASQKIKNQK